MFPAQRQIRGLLGITLAGSLNQNRIAARPSEIYADTLAALEASPKDYSLASLRYDLSKLRAKGLVERVPRSRRYRLLRDGYSVCLVFLKLFERIYAPLTAGLLSPVSGDKKLQQQKRSQLDRLYQRVVDDLDKLMDAVGLKAA
jgi:DNA-binding transcriptional ArsR family regulator